MRFKRYASGLLLVLLISVLFSGCSFKLRTAAAWPAELQPVATETTPQGRDFMQLLRRTLAEQGVALSGDFKSRIIIKNEQHIRRVQSLDAEGRVNEYQLQYEVTLQLNDHENQPLFDRRKYSSQRSYAYDPSRALGHQWQELEMVERMRQQAIEQFMQQVALKVYPEGSQ